MIYFRLMLLDEIIPKMHLSILAQFQKRFVGWKGKNLFIGGRLVLINLVLSSLPLYFFSFYKALSKVILELVKIQRRFILQGWSESQKISWVSWEQVSRHKSEGVQRRKTYLNLNLSPLAKWKWRLLTDSSTIWYNPLVLKYGNLQLPHDQQ